MPLDLGRVQGTRNRLARARGALPRARPQGRVSRNVGQRVDGARGARTRRSRRRGVRRRGHAARLPRGRSLARLRPRGREEGQGARRGRRIAMRSPDLTREQIKRRVRELGEWFHNMDLGGVETAPHHFLGDYPRVKWRRFAHVVPEDLRGMTVLDIGCNAGFYAIEMKRRGADRVVGIDTDEAYLAQARFAAQVHGVEIELRTM